MREMSERIIWCRDSWSFQVARAGVEVLCMTTGNYYDAALEMFNEKDTLTSIHLSFNAHS